MFPNLPRKYFEICKLITSQTPSNYVAIEEPDCDGIVALLYSHYGWDNIEEDCIWIENYNLTIPVTRFDASGGYYQMTPSIIVRDLSISEINGSFCCQRRVEHGNSALMVTRFGDAEFLMTDIDFIHATSKEDADTLSMMLAMLLA